MIRFTITIGKGETAKTREVIVDPDEITLGFMEDMETAQETGKWRDLFKPMGEMLDLSRDELRAITNKQFRELTTAMQSSITEQTTVPN
ncbi:MAG TPA: hypothetical protein VFZ66_29590 [Herpetosiphonaceae bacterium]